MNSPFSDEEAMRVETVRTFVDRDVKPTVREVDHANTHPEARIEQLKGIGIYGLAIGAEYGGAPVSMPCYVLVSQELARGWMSLAGAMGGHTVVAKLLGLFGTAEQRQRYLPAMATGELRATMALTELGGGSDLQTMATTALPDGPANLVVNGSKTWISNARHSGLIALCKTDPHATPRHRGISIARVENPSTGLTVSRDLPKLGNAPLMIVGEGTNEIQRNVIAAQLVARGGIRALLRRRPGWLTTPFSTGCRIPPRTPLPAMPRARRTGCTIAAG